MVMISYSYIFIVPSNWFRTHFLINKLIPLQAWSYEIKTLAKTFTAYLKTYQSASSLVQGIEYIVGVVTSICYIKYMKVNKNIVAFEKAL